MQDCEHSFTTQAPPPSPTPDPSPISMDTETVDKPPLNKAPFIFGLTTSIAAGASAVAVAAPLLTQSVVSGVQTVTTIPNFFANFWLNLLSLFATSRKRRPWGVAKDSLTGEPLPGTTVTLLAVSQGISEKSLEKTITDKAGRFGFLAGTGSYRVEASKAGYTYPTKLLQHVYDGHVIHLKDNQTITLELFLDHQIKKTNWSYIIRKLVTLLDWLRLPLLIAGTSIAIYTYLFYPTKMIAVFLIIYAVLWLLEILNLKRSRNTLELVDETGKPLPFTLMRFIDEKTKKVIANKVTDRIGEVYVLLPHGRYLVTVPSPRHPQGATASVNLPRGVAPRHIKIAIEY